MAAWKAVVERHDRAHAREVQQLTEQIASLTSELADRPEKVVTRYVDQGEMDEAKNEAERAFRSRDYAYEALCEVRLLHRGRSDGSCRCGKQADKCDEAKILSDYPGLIAWEKRQVEREREGLDNGLPRNHPARLDPRWNDWDE